ncbi:MAG: hypothetical protein WDA28_13190 [Castellaniella sp.]
MEVNTITIQQNGIFPHHFELVDNAAVDWCDFASSKKLSRSGMSIMITVNDARVLLNIPSQSDIIDIYHATGYSIIDPEYNIKYWDSQQFLYAKSLAHKKKWVDPTSVMDDTGNWLFLKQGILQIAKPGVYIITADYPAGELQPKYVVVAAKSQAEFVTAVYHLARRAVRATMILDFFETEKAAEVGERMMQNIAKQPEMFADLRPSSACPNAFIMENPGGNFTWQTFSMICFEALVIIDPAAAVKRTHGSEVPTLNTATPPLTWPWFRRPAAPRPPSSRPPSPMQPAEQPKMIGLATSSSAAAPAKSTDRRLKVATKKATIPYAAVESLLMLTTGRDSMDIEPNAPAPDRPEPPLRSSRKRMATARGAAYIANKQPRRVAAPKAQAD